MSPFRRGCYQHERDPKTQVRVARRDVLPTDALPRNWFLVSMRLVPGLTTVVDIVLISLVGVGVNWIYVGSGPGSSWTYVAIIAVYAGLTVELFHHFRLYAFQTIASWPDRMPA